MIRPDSLGITAVLRAFGLYGLAYKGVCDFFRSNKVNPYRLQKTWSRTVSRLAPKIKIGGRTVLVGDGTPRTTEGKFQLGQTPMKSSSNNQSRSSSFIGQLYGCVCVLARSSKKTLGIPLFFSLQQGIKMLSVWKGRSYYKHYERILLDAIQAAYSFGSSYLVLDRFFLKKGLLSLLKECDCQDLLDVVIRARIDTKAYEFPEKPPKGKRGRKPRKGADVKVRTLFDEPDRFTSARLPLYGKKETVYYRTANYLWGQGLYFPLRFVLAKYGKKRTILATSDLTMKPEDVIVAYAHRFKIEHTFKTFKNVFGGLRNHFWTKSLGQKASMTRSSDKLMEKIDDPDDQQKVIDTVKAIEIYTTCSTIAMGITQLLCLLLPGMDKSDIPYQRTPSKKVLSEREMKMWLQLNMERLINSYAELAVSQIIKAKRARYGRNKVSSDTQDDQNIA